MAFNSTIEIRNTTAYITLAGELDASVAPQFRAHVEQAVAQKAQRLVLFMQELSYMSSAGLRALAFAKQKMGSGTDIYVIGAQESVVETIKMTGFDKSVILQASYDPSLLAQ